MSTGYEQIYLDLLPRLAKCDLAESARRLGLESLANGDVSADFCGRRYFINNAGVHPVDPQPVSVNHRSVLAYYILSKGRGEPDASFVPFHRMTGMIQGQKVHETGLMVQPLLREFGADYPKFESAALKLSGTRGGISGDGGKLWDFQVLPKIIVRLVYYEPDDEFPADIQILFNRNATSFLEFECLAFLCGCFTHSLIAASSVTLAEQPR